MAVWPFFSLSLSLVRLGGAPKLCFCVCVCVCLFGGSFAFFCCWIRIYIEKRSKGKIAAPTTTMTTLMAWFDEIDQCRADTEREREREKKKTEYNVCAHLAQRLATNERVNSIADGLCFFFAECYFLWTRKRTWNAAMPLWLTDASTSDRAPLIFSSQIHNT